MRRSDFPLCAVYLGHVQRDAKEQKRREDGEKTYLNALPFTNVFFLYGIQRPLGLSLFFCVVISYGVLFTFTISVFIPNKTEINDRSTTERLSRTDLYELCKAARGW